MTTDAAPPGFARAAPPGLAAAFVRLSHVVQYEMADVGRVYDLTPQQTQLLCQLNGGPVGMAELGRSLHVEKSSLTGLIDRVERRGLVTRIPDPRDRRALRVALTGDGAQLAVRARVEVAARLDALAEGLSAAERDRLISVVERVVAGHVATADCARPGSA